MGRFSSIAFFLVLPSLAFCADTPQPGALDPVFSQVPFEQWLTRSADAHMRFSARVSDPRLSPHQRLLGNVSIQVDGAELVRLHGKGQLLLLIQLDDGNGRRWQTHQEIDLGHVAEGMKSNNAQVSQQFFVLPGDYSVSIALYANATGDHSVLTRHLHVAPLRNDPLPDAWRGLPAVEFIPSVKAPDTWLLPPIGTRLHLAATTATPARIDLVVNLTPSEQFAGSSRIQDRYFGVLLPSTRVLAQIDWGTNMSSLRLLDLLRHRIAYQHDGDSDLDWSSAGESLTEVNPGVIDARSLEQRRFSADFFVTQVRLRVHAAGRSGKPSAVIVLSPPVQFDEGQDLRPITFNRPPNVKVYYIRYQPPAQIFLGPPGPIRPPQTIRSDFVAVDQLEPLLKTLDPHLFDVRMPEQFRKALATILGEISRL